ncbi:hypothetical protein MFIFM68171_09888 [Madurella fahalii]|uniref:Uncharacterized protein n=1 Tax=Madurella fahalii TaxID=1157608 RepID=A0ABQ0GPL0_9PEZI
MKRITRLRQVKNIQFVQFNPTDKWRADIVEEGIWPPSETDPLTRKWIYAPCPPDVPPLVSSIWLMTTWRDVHHTDATAFREFWQSAPWSRRVLERVKHAPHLAVQGLRDLLVAIAPRADLIDLDDIDVDPTVTSNTLPEEVHPTDEEQPGGRRRSMYIHKRFPKLTTGKPQAGYDDEEEPKAWHLAFEAGFHIHQAMVYVLILSTVCIVGFSTWFLWAYEWQSPTKPLDVLALIGVMASYLSFVVSVWFKWAEQ